MFHRIEKRLRNFRKHLSRSRWLTKLLRLSVSDESSTRPGLLMIQIDGLSRAQFERALATGEMPFMKRLIDREHYRLHSQYSGLPASTPGVQGELFYGIRCAVPAFEFLDNESNDVVRMYEPGPVRHVQSGLEAETTLPLLAGGSAYADCFTGGADEAHFCPSSIGWGRKLSGASWLAFPVLVLMNLYAIARIGVLLMVELMLGVTDFFRGISRGQDLIKELKFIPTRVGICILLRELCVTGVKIDLHRGLPVIHVNFLGYDEQAHRRGPDSLFAHWTLKGIDDAVARLWRAAHRSPRRHYDVWIYSDHGQARMEPYLKRQGYGIDEAVSKAYNSIERTPSYSLLEREDNSVQTHRVRVLGGTWFQHLFSVLKRDDRMDPDIPVVTALGPVGFLYFPDPLETGELEHIADKLVTEHGVPAAIVRDDDGGLRARSSSGRFRLPEQAAELFGPDHPFLDELGRDIAQLCRHPDAGGITILGWCSGSEPLTFALENGSHAGPSPEETHAFSLLPADTALPATGRGYLRPEQLREAALWLLRRRRQPQSPPPGRPSRAGRPLRLMTYNVHSCTGMDGKVSVERIARVIALAAPDVVALQELDVGRMRTEGEDQARLIARLLEMELHFHPAMNVEEEQYGEAILSHLPMKLVKAGALPGVARKIGFLEPRGALRVEIDYDGTPVHVINTHLGLFPGERNRQIEELLGEKWLEDPRYDVPVILCGDFNAMPSSRVCRLVRDRLTDAQEKLESHRPRGTYYSRLAATRLDHVFIDDRLDVVAIDVPRHQLARVASDHLPLVTDIIAVPHKENDSYDKEQADESGGCHDFTSG